MFETATRICYRYILLTLIHKYSMRLEYQDSIDRYLMNRMSDEERTLFETKCSSNPEMKEQLEHTQVVKAVISERNKMLGRIQKWDEEYDEEKKAASRKKRVAIYWSTGIAAAFVAGCFLLPTTNNPESEGMGYVVSMNTEKHEVLRKVNPFDSIEENIEHEKLLAKNELKEKKEEKNANKLGGEQVLSFAEDMVFTSGLETKEDFEKKIVRVNNEIRVVTETRLQLIQKLKSGEISQSVYDSRMYMLKFQRDELYWQKSNLLINLNRRNEAIALLDEIRNEDGAFQSEADSLYKELNK